jgi:hypothetical protein
MSDDRGRSATGPVLAPPGQSPAAASRPDRSPDDERWHQYESTPVPWWISVMWTVFFVFGVVYLIVNLMQ